MSRDQPKPPQRSPVSTHGCARAAARLTRRPACRRSGLCAASSSWQTAVKPPDGARTVPTGRRARNGRRNWMDWGGGGVNDTYRPTMEDVARVAGVSRTTVSFVLNNRDGARIAPETRDRVQQVPPSSVTDPTVAHAPWRRAARPSSGWSPRSSPAPSVRPRSAGSRTRSGVPATPCSSCRPRPRRRWTPRPSRRS